MKCPNCGKEIAEDSLFCEFCGAKVVSQSNDVPMMSFVDAVKTCFSKYVVFEGRATRSEYWWWFLFNILVGLVTGFIDELIGLDWGVNSLVSLVLILPSLAVAVRRMHDIKKSGWFILVPLYNIYLFCQPTVED